MIPPLDAALLSALLSLVLMYPMILPFAFIVMPMLVSSTTLTTELALARVDSTLTVQEPSSVSLAVLSIVLLATPAALLSATLVLLEPLLTMFH